MLRPPQREAARLTLYRIVGSSAIYGVAGAISKGAALLTVPILARQLSPDGYGLADLAASFAALLTLAVRFGADIPATRMRALAETPERRRRVMWMLVVMTCVLSSAAALLLLPLSGVIASVLWSTRGEASIAALSVILIPVSAVQATLGTIQRLESRPITYAALNLIDLLAQMLLAVAFALLGFGPFGVLLGYVLGSGVGLVAAWFPARSYLQTDPDWPLGWELVRAGLPFLPASLAFVFADSVARMLVASAVSISEVGYLALAIRLSSVMALAAGAFSLAWGPFGLSLPAGERTSRIYGRVLTTSVLGIVSVSVLLGAAAPELVQLVSGADYAPAAVAMPGLLLGAGCIAVVYIQTTAAGRIDRGRLTAISITAGAATQVALVALLLPIAGLMAVGVAAVSGRFLSAGLLGVYVRSEIDAPVWRLLLFGLLGAATVILLQLLNQAPEATALARLGIGSAAALGLVAVVPLDRWLRARAERGNRTSSPSRLDP